MSLGRIKPRTEHFTPSNFACMKRVVYCSWDYSGSSTHWALYLVLQYTLLPRCLKLTRKLYFMPSLPVIDQWSPRDTLIVFNAAQKKIVTSCVGNHGFGIRNVYSLHLNLAINAETRWFLVPEMPPPRWIWYSNACGVVKEMYHILVVLIAGFYRTVGFTEVLITLQPITDLLQDWGYASGQRIIKRATIRGSILKNWRTSAVIRSLLWQFQIGFECLMP